MRKSYKRVAAAAAAVFMAVSMVGCSSKTSGEQVQETKQETEQGEEQEKELKVLTLKKENVDLFDDMLADYSKDHPGVTFKQTSGKQENLLTLISTNEVPDIMNVWPMNSLFREMMKEGVFMDLSGSEVLANVPENILEACRYDGKDYSVPISVNSYSMFYNTELFEKEGLTYPKTEDEFWTLCDTLKSRGIPAVTIGDKDIGLLQGYFARMLTGTASHDAKEITGYESCHSDADIFIQTQIHYENTLPRKYVKKTSVKFPRLFYLYFRIGKYRLSPFFIWSPYEHYSKSTMESRLKLLDHFYLPVYIGVVGLTPYKPVMKKYTDQQLQDKLNRYFLRYCEDLDKKGVEIIQNDVKIDTGSKEGAISGTLTIICNTGQSRQSEIPQLPNDPEEQIEQLGE